MPASLNVAGGDLQSKGRFLGGPIPDECLAGYQFGRRDGRSRLSDRVSIPSDGVVRRIPQGDDRIDPVQHRLFHPVRMDRHIDHAG